MSATILNTPMGPLLIKGDKTGISEIQYDGKDGRSDKDIPESLREGIRQLTAYFDGNLSQFDLRLNPEGTSFQKQVWDNLKAIPFGRTRTYKEQAQKLGNLNAIRAVASANGKNPLPIVVPCHRVIGSDGSLTGYAGGLWRKKWLLEHEGALPQKSLF